MRSTALLYILAAIMIVNSHLEDLYPSSWMAADGLIGQCIFFFLSGYGVAKTLLKRDQSFLEFYGRRISRVYPALIPAVLLLVYIPRKGWGNWSFSHYLREFTAPKEFGFIQNIMVFYFVLWLLFRFKEKISAVVITMAFCILACFIIFISDPVRNLQSGTTIGKINGWFYWFFFGLMTLMGCFAGMSGRNRRSYLIPDLAFTGLIFLAYVALKLALFKGWKIPFLNWNVSSIYIFLFVLMIPLNHLLFSILTRDGLLKFVRSIKWLSWICAILGGATLEIYLTHEIAVGPVESLKFPVNLLVYYPIILMIGCAAKLAADKFRNLLHID